jgi:hypothetical protein
MMELKPSAETLRNVLPLFAVMIGACGSHSSHDIGDSRSGQSSADAKPAHASDSASGEANPSNDAGAKLDASEPSELADAAISSGAAPIDDGLPCDVLQVLASNCQKCHSAAPMFGAPMSLVSYADLQKPSVSDPTLTVAQVAQKRINDQAAPMPPGGDMGADDRKALNDWLAAGAKQAPETERACDVNHPTRSEDYWKAGLSPGPDETCYNFTNHQGQTVDDTTPYTVIPGEHYEQFYFEVPWGADMVATKFGTKFDNLAVVHHWLFFTTNKASSTAGTHETSIGTTIGDSSNLLAGWAVGGDNLIFDDDVGLELPSSGMLNAQWHFNNQSDQPQTDASALQVCVVPKAKRKNISSVTFLGTENLGGLFGMPAHQTSQFAGSCLNDSGGPITIWGLTPHMHKLGRHMTTAIKHSDGSLETVFDKDFDFNSQITYPLKPAIVLQAGESIQSTCTFDNETDGTVPFGPSTTQEMCYNFTMSYPAKALDNGVFSLIGALDTCW